MQTLPETDLRRGTPRVRRRQALATRVLIELLAALAVVLAADALLTRALVSVQPGDYRAFIDARRAFPENTPPQILVLGDSHIADAFVPDIVRQATGRTSFNFAVYGSGPIEWHALAMDLLARAARPPELVIIGTNPEMFRRATSGGRYTPELIEDATLRVALLRHSGLAEDPFLLLESYRQRDLLPALLRRLRGLPPPPQVRVIEAIDAGYIRNVRHMRAGDAVPASPHFDWINPAQIQAFRDLLALFAAHHVEVVIADPPLLPTETARIIHSGKYAQFDRIVDAAILPYGLRRYDFRTSAAGSALDYRDFLNANHVCASGAAYFSATLAGWLTGVPEATTLTRAGQARTAYPCSQIDPSEPTR